MLVQVIVVRCETGHKSGSSETNKTVLVLQNELNVSTSGQPLRRPFLHGYD